jgi:hypothetical protein
MEMTATPIVHNGVGGDADILTHMFGTLVDGRTPAEVSELLQRAQCLITVTSQTMQQRKDLENRLSAVIIFLEQGLPISKVDGLRMSQRLMLLQATELCEEIAANPSFDHYWRFVALSLRAECLYVLDSYTEALREAEAAQAMLPDVMPVSPTIEARSAYHRHLLSQPLDLPITGRGLLDSIQRELLSM